MSSPVISENLFLLYSLGMGIFITFVYDLLRIGRRVIPHNGFFVSAEDFLFWIFCAISVFYLMHTQSNGTLRWFAILGALAGMLLYRKTVSRFFVKWVSEGLKFILKYVNKALSFVTKPFRFAAHKLYQKGKSGTKKKLTAFRKLLRIILCKQ